MGIVWPPVSPIFDSVSDDPWARDLDDLQMRERNFGESGSSGNSCDLV
ncbi:MAG: hypothetical protein UX21_C0005G0005 [Microgenomates group bacterium GW2011_GWC2_45_8]|nr:MAG: hypothetical protein UX21_C0005G0005 [Microgenomates group bacterium GW2011_GWC2_45_8]